ncbi:MAG: DUF456 domain-containing protein [Elusimicrobia bacterium]|nr:DUF456 domain-containing protein [Elusimicrobiota bacterium]
MNRNPFLLAALLLPSFAHSAAPAPVWYTLLNAEGKPTTLNLCPNDRPALFRPADLKKVTGRVDVRVPHNIDLYCGKSGAEPELIKAVKLSFCFEGIDCRGTFSRRRGLYLSKDKAKPALVGYREATAADLPSKPITRAPRPQPPAGAPRSGQPAPANPAEPANPAAPAPPSTPATAPETPASRAPTAAPGKRLNPLELSLLTPLERRIYVKTFLEPAEQKVPGAEEKLLAESARLRALIAAEKRAEDPAYDAPGDIEAFKKLPGWHKRIFCDPKQAGAAAAAADDGKTIFDPGSDAMKALKELERQRAEAAIAAIARIASQNGKLLPEWASGPCAQFLANSAGNPNAPGSATANVPAPDAEVKGKEPNKWLTSDLLTSAAKGGMVGLIVGSLFGPVGLIVGPLLGAALFYGLTKITSD